MMHKKRLISGIVLFLIVLSSFAFAQEEAVSSDCSGFWGAIKCFLFGSAENRAGKSWFDRENVVGEVDRVTSFDVQGHPDWRKVNVKGITYYIVLKKDNTALFYEGIPDRPGNEPIPYAELDEGIARAVVEIIKHDIPDYNPPVSDSPEPAPVSEKTTPTAPAVAPASAPVAPAVVACTDNCLDITRFISGNKNVEELLDSWRKDARAEAELSGDSKIATLTTTSGTITLTSLDGQPLRGSKSIKVTFAPKGTDTLRQTLLQVQSGAGYTTLASYNGDDETKGLLKVGEQQVYVGEGLVTGQTTGGLSVTAKALTDLGKGEAVTYYQDAKAKERREAKGSIKYDSASQIRMVTDFEDETQTKEDYKKGTRTSIEGDIFDSSERGSGCTGGSSSRVGGTGSAISTGAAHVCFQPEGGIETKVNPDGSTTTVALINYDYEDGKLVKAEYFSPQDGRYIGAEITVPGYDKPVKIIKEGSATRITYNGEEAVFVEQDDGSFRALSGLSKEGDTIDDFLRRATAKTSLSGAEQVSFEQAFRLRKDSRDFLGKDWNTLNPTERRDLFQSLCDGRTTYADFLAETAYSFNSGGKTYSVDAEGTIYLDGTTLTEAEAQAVKIAVEEVLFNDHVEFAKTKTEEELRKHKEAIIAAEKKVDETVSKAGTSKAGEAAAAEISPPDVSAQDVLGSIYAITDSVKSYPALSQLFEDWFGGKFSNFLFDADKAFAPMLGSQWFPSAICEGNYDIEPDGMAVIKTSSGTYQTVAHLEAERSPEKTPLLCERYETNESPEVQWVCSKGQVCVDNNLCYPDADGDEEPDSENPVEGYFYKITWAAAAPADETFTPFVDENGVAVSLNIFLDGSEDGKVSAGNIPLYRRGPKTIGVLELKNGARDRNIITKYSNSQFTEACIGWDKAPSSVNIAERAGNVAAGTSTIGDVCNTVVESELGQVNWDHAERPTSSVTSTSSDVTLNTDW